MMKPGIPKGTRDFSASEIAKRKYIFNTIQHSFEKFGFEPIETPSFENLTTLMGKYGEEGDRLIFKILNSGNYLSSFDKKYYNKLFIISNEVQKFEVEFRKLYFKELNNDVNSYISHIYENELVLKDLNISKEYLIEKTINLYSKHQNDEEIFKYSLSNIINEFIGNYLQNISNIFSNEISDKALRYDLTVPFARYVVQHFNELVFPFKRYQMQPVWRADRPQKGRFREFYQCDADVVGSKSLWQEVEFVQLYDDVFNTLGVKKISIKINNRKILSGIAEVIGASEKLIDFTVALDKLDKIGKEGVIKEWKEKEISDVAIKKLLPIFDLKGNNQQILNKLEQLLAASEEGKKGIEEMRFILEKIEKIGLETAQLVPDITLARGLNYYTGTILEVTADEAEMGSVGGGGRYDDLTGIFGLKNMSGVGISFGLDRIYLVMEQLSLFDRVETSKPDVLIINFGDDEALYTMPVLKELREQGIKAELYPEAGKMKKQLTYADKRQIPFILIAGTEEINNQQITLKNMISGEQEKLEVKTICPEIKKRITNL